jgi:phosphate transport system ATP-binding protein
MYLGQMIEFTPTADMFLKPRTQRAQDYVSGRFG